MSLLLPLSTAHSSERPVVLLIEPWTVRKKDTHLFQDPARARIKRITLRGILVLLTVFSLQKKIASSTIWIIIQEKKALCLGKYCIYGRR